MVERDHRENSMDTVTSMQPDTETAGLTLTDYLSACFNQRVAGPLSIHGELAAYAHPCSPIYLGLHGASHELNW